MRVQTLHKKSVLSACGLTQRLPGFQLTGLRLQEAACMNQALKDPTVRQDSMF